MKVIFAGDYYPDGKVEWDSNLETIIKSSDYSIVNFESPIVCSNDRKLHKYGPSLHSSPDSLLPIKQMGFSCLTLANNHTLDYGARALMNTIEHIRNIDFDYIGASDNLANAKRPLIKCIKGAKIAFINCCEHEFSIATNNTPGTNPLDPVSQYNVIKSIKDKVDYIIVIVHGGHEGFQLPSPRMQDTYRFFIDAGANVVVNHHQHCYSGYEEYNNGVIFYGLGNFFFPDDNPSIARIWNEGFILEIDFNDSIITFELYPYFQCIGNRKVCLMEDENKKLFIKNINDLNKIISNRTNLENFNFKWRRETQNAYKISLAPYSNKYFRWIWKKGLLPSGLSQNKLSRLINFIECESHRDRYVDYLKYLFNK